jgi:hypothetical protein
MHRSPFVLLLLASCVVTAGCWLSHERPSSDASIDDGVDVAPDLPSDASIDDGVDIAPDLPSDASVDARPDVAGPLCGSGTACVAGDDCCPSTCSCETDTDCGNTCGNDVVCGRETCDGDCPFTCEDSDPCTRNILTGFASQCNVVCISLPLTFCRDGDLCCPTGCAPGNDDDCP